MPIDPQKRNGRGRFPDKEPPQKLPGDFIDDTMKKAETRTVIFDLMFMMVVGFWNTLKGFMLTGNKNKSE